MHRQITGGKTEMFTKRTQPVKIEGAICVQRALTAGEKHRDAAVRAVKPTIAHTGDSFAKTGAL